MARVEFTAILVNFISNFYSPIDALCDSTECIKLKIKQNLCMHACKETVELDIECTSKQVSIHAKGYGS